MSSSSFKLIGSAKPIAWRQLKKISTGISVRRLIKGDAVVSPPSRVLPFVRTITATRCRMPRATIRSVQCRRWAQSQQAWLTCLWWTVAVAPLNYATKRASTTPSSHQATKRQDRMSKTLPSTWCRPRLAWSKVSAQTPRLCSLTQEGAQVSISTQAIISSNLFPTSIRVSNTTQ